MVFGAVGGNRDCPMRLWQHRKKVGLVYFGTQPLTSAAFGQWVASLPELGVIADLVPLTVDRRSGESASVAAIFRLIRLIAERYPSVDGFVILHEQDFLLYTAAALSFCLTGLSKPVVLTSGGGADWDVASGRGWVPGAKANVINAVQAATLPFADVAVLFGNRLLRGNAAYRVAGNLINAFDAPPGANLGRIDFSIRLLERNLRQAGKGKLVVTTLASRVEYLPLTPWVDAEAVRRRVVAAAAVLVEARHSLKLPAWLPELVSSIKPAKPIAILTASPEISFPSGPAVTLLPVGTREAMHAKLAWATALVKTPAKVSALMGRDVAGEFTL